MHEKMSIKLPNTNLYKNSLNGHRVVTFKQMDGTDMQTHGAANKHIFKTFLIERANNMSSVSCNVTGICLCVATT